MSEKIKILIAEDNDLFRTSLKIALEHDHKIEIIGKAINGEQALDFLKKNQPDLALLDIGMPILNGLDTCKAIKNKYPEIKVIIFSIYDDEESVLEALRAKADAYCTKDTSFEKLIEVIYNVMDGAIWLDPVIASYVHNFITRSREEHKESFDLSQREFEVLVLMARGLSNKEIASELFVTVHTAKAHVCNILQKLSAKDRTEAAVKASKHGLI